MVRSLGPHPLLVVGPLVEERFFAASLKASYVGVLSPKIWPPPLLDPARPQGNKHVPVRVYELRVGLAPEDVLLQAGRRLHGVHNVHRNYDSRLNIRDKRSLNSDRQVKFLIVNPNHIGVKYFLVMLGGGAYCFKNIFFLNFELKF